MNTLQKIRQTSDPIALVMLYFGPAFAGWLVTYFLVEAVWKSGQAISLPALIGFLISFYPAVRILNDWPQTYDRLYMLMKRAFTEVVALGVLGIGLSVIEPTIPDLPAVIIILLPVLLVFLSYLLLYRDHKSDLTQGGAP